MLVAGVALVVLLAGYAGYAVLSTHSSGTVLTIYTYPSFLGGGCGANGSAVLQPFETAHHLTLRFVCPLGTLASTLINAHGTSGADLVVGLDEVTGPQAEAAGILVPYSPPGLAEVPPALTAELSATGTVTPYEWGYLGVDACAPYVNSTGGAAGNFSFPAVAQNRSLAQNLIVEDPTLDITGEEFLLWEIAFYSTVLHTAWQPWWLAVAPHLSTADSWDTAFGEFTCGAGAPQMVVSYLTDPAYAAAYGAPGTITSSVSHWNGTEYGWRSVYGASIVQGTSHLALDQQFLQYLLTGPVQSAFPMSEWEYPANSTVPVPAVFDAAPNSSAIVALNAAYPPATIVANLSTWIDAWQTTVNRAG